MSKLPEECLQNLSSIFNDGNMTVTNSTITDTLTADSVKYGTAKTDLATTLTNINKQLSGIDGRLKAVEHTYVKYDTGLHIKNDKRNNYISACGVSNVCGKQGGDSAVWLVKGKTNQLPLTIRRA